MPVVKQVMASGEVDFLQAWPAPNAREFSTVPTKDRALELELAEAEALAFEMNERFGTSGRYFEVEAF